MPLPSVDQTVIDNVKEDEAEQAREKALETVKPEAAVEAKQEVAVAENKEAAPTSATGTAIANANEANSADIFKELAAMGFADLQIDFTSFPTLVINKGKIKRSGGDAVDGGESVEFIIMDKRKTYLFRGVKGRDDDPKLAYSDDKIHVNMTGELVADTIELWKKEGYEPESNAAGVPTPKEYFIIMVHMVGGEMNGEMAQLQIPKTSIGRFDGHLVNCMIAKKKPMEVITRALVGEEVGSGIKAFNPWDFKVILPE